MILRSANNYDRDAASRATDFFCVGPSLTIQSQGVDADINVIMRRFGVTGQLPQVAMPPTYGDFMGVTDYQQALELISAANSSFLSLPAEVRSRFKNDAAAFVDFCSDEKNLDEMRKLGLAVPEVSPSATAPADAVPS